MSSSIKNNVIEGIQEVASKQLCLKEVDTIISETALRIIQLVESKNQENSITTIYKNFSLGYPISDNNKNKLINFLRNGKNIKLGQKIFSQINLLVGDKNREFINNFLINVDGKNDISKFVEYVLTKLENYTFTINFEYDKIDEIINGSPENNRVFKYTRNGKRGLITTKTSGEKYILPEKYDKLEYRRNGTFCGILKENGTYHGEYIKFIGNEYKVIGKINDIKDIPNLSTSDGNLIYTTIGGKKGLQKFEDNKFENRVLNQKLIPEYDSITVKNGLILASKNIGGKKQNLEIFGKDYKKLIIYEDIEDYSLIEGIDNTFKLKTSTGYCYYEIIDNGEIKEISFLQDVKTILRPDDIQQVFKNLQEGRPVFIKYHGDSCYCISKKDDEIVYYHLGSKFSNIVLNDFGLDKKTFCCYDINGITYIFDKSTKILYKSNKKYKTQKTRTLDELKKDLEKIEGISI